MKFYFASIAKLKSTDELSEEVDNPMFGTILHAAMQTLYSKIEGIANPAAELQQMLKTKAVEEAVSKAINDNYLNNPDADEREYTGSLMLVKKIIIRYIRNGIIPFDIRHNSFAVEGVEKDIEWPLPIDNERNM